MERLRLSVAAVVVLALLGGCDAIFTTSPVSFLQRDPDNMSLDQRINFAEDALASGDEDAIADAYDAIKDDAASSTDGELELLAAQLAMELSGLPDILRDILSEDIDFGLGIAANELLLENLLATLDDTYTDASAGSYLGAYGEGGALTSTDYFMGALVILADAADADELGNVSALEATVAADFIASGITALGLTIDDPSYDILYELQSFLEMF